MLEMRHLATLYDLLAEMPTGVPRRMVRDGSMSADEIVEATQELANELNREPIIESADLED